MTISNQIISFKLSGINFSGNATQLNYTSNVTAGTALASKALVLDSNRSVAGIENITSNVLTANSFIGTIGTAAQPNITSLGILPNLTVSNNLTLSNHNGTNGLILGSTLVTASATQLNYNNITTIGSGQASKALILDSSRNIININSLTTTSLIATNINFNGVNITSSATQLNYNNITTAGIAEASKTLILNSSSNITNINSLTATTLIATNITGLLTTATQTNITSVGTLTSLNLNGAISGVSNLSLSGTITGATTISATTLTGTLSTASQSNITSVGTLINLTVSGNISSSSLSLTTLNLGGTNILSTAAEINTLAGVVNGTGAANKSLTLDSSRNITNINSLTTTNLIATSLAGSLTTPAQSAITSIGTLTSLNTSGLISTTIVNNTSTLVPYNEWINGSVITKLYMNNAISTFGTHSNHPLMLTTNNNTNNCLYLGTNGNVNVGTNTSTTYKLNIEGSLNCLSLNINGTSLTSSATELNTLAGITPGTAYASKALVLDNLLGISGITSLSATTLSAINLTGTLTTVSQPNITSVGVLSSLTINGTNNSLTVKNLTSNSRANILFTNDSKNVEIGLRGSTDATSSNSFYIFDSAFRFIIDPTGNIGIGSISSSYKLHVAGSLNCTSFYINGSQINSTATELNYLNSITAGTASASKALVFDSSRNITNINSLTASTLTGTLTTPAQTAITSVGTLTSLTLAGTLSGVTNLSLSGTITGATSISATSLTGSLTTPAQTAITSVGNLTSLAVVGNTKIGNVSGAAGDLLHLEGNISSSLGIQIENRNSTDQCASHISFMGYNSTNNDYDLAKIKTLYSYQTANFGYGILTFLTRNSSSASEGSERMRIDFNGNIGIGTTSPSYKLDVNGSINSTSLFINGSQNTSTGTELSYNAGITPGIATASKTLVLNSSKNINGINYLAANGLCSGDITDPLDTTRLLTAIRSTMPTSSAVHYLLGQGLTTFNSGVIKFTYVGSGSSSNRLSFSLYSGADILNILPTGGVGINNISPGAQLDITGSSTFLDGSNNRVLRLNNAHATPIIVDCQISPNTAATSTNGAFFGTKTNNNFSLMTNNMNRMLITSTGNVGIGNVSPAYTLDVTGNINASGNLYVNGSVLSTTYTSGITEGTAQASKALVLNSSNQITTGISKLVIDQTITPSLEITTTSTYYPQIKLTNSTYSVYLTAYGSNYNNSFSLMGSFGGYQNDILSARAGASASQPYVGIGGQNPNYTLDVFGNLNTVGFYLSGSQVTSTAAELNYLDISSIGTAQASKALVVDSNKDITGIRTLNLNQNITRPLVILNSSLPSGNSISISLGKSAATDNQGEITFIYSGTSGQSSLNLGHFGSPQRMTILSNGNVGINNTNPTETLYISGTLYASNYVNTGLYYLAGTQIMDGSRNLTNIGYVSASNFVASSSYMNCNSGYRINGTTVIDSSRNLTSIGSVSGSSYYYTGQGGYSGSFVSNWPYSSYWGIGADSSASNTVRIGTCDTAGNWYGYGNLRVNSFYAGGYVGIGTASPVYPLQVTSTAGGDASYNYFFYLGPGSSNGSTTTTPSNVSIRSHGRLLVSGEIDVISDYRKKENIKLLDQNYCNNFVKNIKPKEFNYKNEPNGKLFGYIAQDLIKGGFGELIMVEVDPESKEFIDEDGFKSEAGRTYTLSRSQIIAILHNSLKTVLNNVDDLNNENEELKQKNEDLEKRLKKLEDLFLNS